MANDALLLAAALIILAIAQVWLSRRARRHVPQLRAPAGVEQARQALFKAVEGGRGVHVSLGRGGLQAAASPVSLAALAAADSLARPASAGDLAPLVTVGDGTLLPVAEDVLRRGYASSGRLPEYRPGMVQYLADGAHAEAYAAGVSYLLQRQRCGSGLLVGRLGPELAIMTEAGRRQQIDLVTGSDDLLGLAVALPSSGGVLVGEDLFAAGPTMQQRPAQLAGLQLQDVLRLVTILGLIVAAILSLVFG